MKIINKTTPLKLGKQIRKKMYNHENNTSNLLIKKMYVINHM